MYGMMPSANTVARDELAAGEQVVQAEQPAAVLLIAEEVRQGDGRRPPAP